ncbi:MAG: mechanosensitive ion channel family protein [Terriglobia bacterium]
MRSGNVVMAGQLHSIQHAGFFTPDLILYVSIPGALIAAVGIGYAIRTLIHRLRVKAKTPWGNLALAILQELPIPLLLLVAGDALVRVLVLQQRYEQLGAKLIFALVVAVVFYFLAKVAIAFMHHAAFREPSLERITQPAVFVIRLLFIILATVIILENLGIHLVAVWTTLGVGSVAIALGLQETLSNAFAGLYIMADRPIVPGDYVKLDTGHEGYVVRIGWRATSLRTLGNNVIYVPNASMGKAVITNYSKPEERMSVGIPVSVVYNSDPGRVEQILVDIAQEAAREGVDGLLAQPEPIVRFIPGFGASSLDFSLYVQLRRFVDQYLVQSELRKRIFDRFSKEGIQMPFPTRTVLFDQAALDALRGSKVDGREEEGGGRKGNSTDSDALPQTGKS